MIFVLYIISHVICYLFDRIRISNSRKIFRRSERLFDLVENLKIVSLIFH